MNRRAQLKNYFDSIAVDWDIWSKKNRYYHKQLEKEFLSVVPKGKKILEIGCATGDLLNALKPSHGVGIDLSKNMLLLAEKKYPQYKFILCDAHELDLGNEKFDFIVLSDLVGYLDDIYTVFQKIRPLLHENSLVIINSYNFLWEYPLKIAEMLGTRMHQNYQNWLTLDDIGNLFYLTDFKISSKKSLLLFPGKIPLISDLINSRLAKLPFLRQLNLINFIVASALPEAPAKKYSVTVLVPCRNEAGNIRECIEGIPDLGAHTEIIFVDGKSSDGTVELIEDAIKTYKGIKDIKLIHQVSRNASRSDEISKNKMLKLGKADAVRKGFDAATGDILMILDADLCVPPDELYKFFETMATGKAEFVNGSRLVYRPEYGAMNGVRFFGNRLFSKVFSYLLGQNITDTLCGTKVLFKSDYERIKPLRKLFGNFDPFGDFELLFTAAKANLKIIDIPIYYQKRNFGETKVSVLKHGLLLFKMCVFGFIRFKLPFFNRSVIDEKQRKLLEIAHGKSIHDNAEDFWGWNTPAGQLRVKRRVDEICAQINQEKKPKLLELGCGTGRFTEEFVKKGIDTIAFDISLDLIKKNKKRCSGSKLLVADVERLPFADASFDYVVGVSILHHLDLHSALKEISRVLKKGGKIVFSEPNMANPQILLQKNISFLKKIMHDTPTETAFLRHKLKKNILKSGFNNVKITPFDFLHPAIPKSLVKTFSKLSIVFERYPLLKEISGSLLIIAEK